MVLPEVSASSVQPAATILTDAPTRHRTRYRGVEPDITRLGERSGDTHPCPPRSGVLTHNETDRLTCSGPLDSILIVSTHTVFEQVLGRQGPQTTTGRRKVCTSPELGHSGTTTDPPFDRGTTMTFLTRYDCRPRGLGHGRPGPPSTSRVTSDASSSETAESGVPRSNHRTHKAGPLTWSLVGPRRYTSDVGPPRPVPPGEWSEVDDERRRRTGPNRQRRPRRLMSYIHRSLTA